MSDSTCPKCSGPRDAKALYCPFCGAVFSRLEGGGASAASAPPPPSAYAEPGEEYQAAPVNPYRAPSASVAPRYRPEPQPTRQQTTLAGRWIRLGAQMLDGLALGLVVIVVAFAAGALKASDETAVYVVIIVAVLVILGINLYLLAERGQTIGKMVLKVRIVRTTGEKASLGRILFLRMAPMNILSAIPYLGVLLSLIDALMIFGEERRCLHDHFADTVVVNA